MKLPLIRAKYRARAVGQLHICGREAIKPNLINVWGPIQVAYFENMRAFEEHFDRWSNQKPWQYELLEVEAVADNELPPNSIIYCTGRRVNRKAA